jgi:hypothetical protein
MWQQVCILHQELQQAVGLVLQHLKKKQRCSGLRQLMVSVHQHQANCVQFIELVPQSVSLIRFHHSDTENSEQPTGMVGRPPTMKHSSFIPQSEPQAEMVMALQHHLHSRPLLEQQALPVRAPKQRLAYTSRQELLMAQVLEIH